MNKLKYIFLLIIIIFIAVFLIINKIVRHDTKNELYLLKNECEPIEMLCKNNKENNNTIIFYDKDKLNIICYLLDNADFYARKMAKLYDMDMMIEITNSNGKIYSFNIYKDHNNDLFHISYLSKAGSITISGLDKNNYIDEINKIIESKNK